MAWSNKGGNPSGPWGRTPGGSSTPPPEGPPPGDFDDAFAKFWEQIQTFITGGRKDNKRSAIVIGLLVVVLWFATGIYSVGPDERGVELRFGAVHDITNPGLSYHLPAPIETVYKPKVTVTNQTEVGMRSLGSGGRSPSIEEESLMLTGDENIIDTNFVVQWRIRDAEKFLFNVREPERTIKAVAESAMREVIGQNDVSTALSSGDGKLRIELDTKKLIQKTLDRYKAGIFVEKVNMGKAEPPSEVIEAFRDVQRAQTDQERARNEAETYRNDIIPRARGEAEQKLQDAEAYKQRVIATAEGEASRFVAIYNEYKTARDVTKKRLYLETMEQVLEGMDKVIIDSKGTQGVLPYLPLQSLKPRAAEGEAKP